MSAAYKNDNDISDEDLTENYKSLCSYYNMKPTRNNKGVSHENGSIESSNGHIKNRLNQELILRGSSNFNSREEYEQWVHAIVKSHNQRNSKNFKVEQQALLELPIRKTTVYEIKSVKVSTYSIINIKQIRYSVPSRLVGHTLTVHINQKNIIAYLGSSEVFRTERKYIVDHPSKYVIDYKHLINAFVKKPRAFRYSQYKDELLPSDEFKVIWEYLDKTESPDIACKIILRLLKICSDYDCEEHVATRCITLIEQKKSIKIEQLESEFSTINPDLPSEVLSQHDLSKYDYLLMKTTQGGGNANV